MGIRKTSWGWKALADRDRWNLRGQALYEPRDDISIRLIADYGEIDELCCTVTNVTNGPTVGAIQFLGGGVADANDQFSYVTYQNKPPVNQVQDGGISLHVDVDFDSFRPYVYFFGAFKRHFVGHGFRFFYSKFT